MYIYEGLKSRNGEGSDALMAYLKMPAACTAGHRNDQPVNFSAHSTINGSALSGFISATAAMEPPMPQK